jgi:hypothetical protein
MSAARENALPLGERKWSRSAGHASAAFERGAFVTRTRQRLRRTQARFKVPT